MFQKIIRISPLTAPYNFSESASSQIPYLGKFRILDIDPRYIYSQVIAYPRKESYICP